MNILMTTMKMDIGGAETHILEAAAALVKRGHDVTVVSAGGVFVPELTKAGVHHIVAPLHTKRPDKVLIGYTVLRRLIKFGKYDLVHAHARIPALLCHLLCKRYHVRFVTTAHLNFDVNFVLKRLSCWGERTVAVSDDIKQYLIDDYGVCSDNISVTINGINTDTYRPGIDTADVCAEFGLSQDKHRIVCVSRMDTDRSEAAIQLAEIAPKLYAFDEKVELLLVGGGNDFDRLRAAADKSNAEIGKKVVILTGGRTDINQMIATGDIFVGVSRAALEAMAMKKPVILAGNQGYLGIFKKEMFKVAYDSNFCCRGAEDTSHALLYRDCTALLSATEEEKDSLGNDCREIIKEHYSVVRMARDYEDMYNAVRPYPPFKYGDILCCGYYGFHNMGDDSLLRAMISNIRALCPDARITVMSKNPRDTRRIYGTHAINRFSPLTVFSAMRHAKLLIFGGGNILQDSSSARSLLYYATVLKMAKRAGCKIMVYANGIGPISLEKNQKIAAEALDLADIITLREHDSIEECRRLGVTHPDIRLTADPAFTLAEADASWSAHLCRRFGIEEDKRYFIIALRNFKKNTFDDVAEVVRTCARLHKEYGLIPVFLSMHDPLDRALTRTAQQLCGCESVFLEGLTGSEILGILRRMEFACAMRLHTLIYSSTVGTPIIGIAYDHKLRSFMETVEQPYVMDTVDADAIVKMAGEILARHADITNELLQKKDALIALAKKDAALALQLITP